jgi:hypothetical protein
MKYSKRNDICLVNPTAAEAELRDPLSNFSFYLSGRVSVLSGFADEIIENLDDGFNSSVVQGEKIGRAESLMWLWILGAYEIVRTMVQAEKCFSPEALNRLRKLKKSLAIVRMPASKMEKQGKRVPVTSNRSPSGWDVENKDLLVNDPEGHTVSARNLLNDFDDTFCSIRKADILARHEDAYK